MDSFKESGIICVQLQSAYGSAVPIRIKTERVSLVPGSAYRRLSHFRKVQQSQRTGGWVARPQSWKGVFNLCLCKENKSLKLL